MRPNLIALTLIAVRLLWYEQKSHKYPHIFAHICSQNGSLFSAKNWQKVEISFWCTFFIYYCIDPLISQKDWCFELLAIIPDFNFECFPLSVIQSSHHFENAGKDNCWTKNAVEIAKILIWLCFAHQTKILKSCVLVAMKGINNWWDKAKMQKTSSRINSTTTGHPVLSSCVELTPESVLTKQFLNSVLSRLLISAGVSPT